MPVKAPESSKLLAKTQEATLRKEARSLHLDIISSSTGGSSIQSDEKQHQT